MLELSVIPNALTVLLFRFVDFMWDIVFLSYIYLYRISYI